MAQVPFIAELPQETALNAGREARHLAPRRV
jgi:hypothetical protein